MYAYHVCRVYINICDNICLYLMYTSSIHWVYFTERLYISCIQIVYKSPQTFYKGKHPGKEGSRRD